MAQRLENWKAVLGQYRYAIEHIPGERNCWGDLLSRWVKVPSVPVRSVAVHSPCDADDSLPSVDVIRAAQRKAVADLGDFARFRRLLVKLPWLMMTCFVCVSGIVMFCGFRLGIRLFKVD